MTGLTFYESPLGIIRIASTGDAVTEILFADTPPQETPQCNSLLLEASCQLDAYFRGQSKIFSFPVVSAGTAFQQKVWNKLLQIPFGAVWSYTRLAQALGDIKCIRAAAAANGKNKLAIVVPCHRVTGMHGSLTGYAGGLWRKQWLLQHEQKIAGIPIQPLLFAND